jgi:hypothetical protein
VFHFKIFHCFCCCQLGLIFFSTKPQVLKNSLHGQISIDFDQVSLKMLEKFWSFWKWTMKNYTRHIPVILGKNEIHKSIFSFVFCSCAPLQVTTVRGVDTGLRLCSRQLWNVWIFRVFSWNAWIVGVIYELCALLTKFNEMREKLTKFTNYQWNA